MNDLDMAVVEFMNEYPLTVTYIQAASGDYDPATATVSGSETQIQVQAIVMDLQLKSDGTSVKYGTLVEAGDRDLYVRPPDKTDPSNHPLVPNSAGDRVIVSGIEYRVASFKTYDPSGSDPILFAFYIKR